MDINDKDKCMQVPVFFQFPCNCNPEDCQPARAKYEEDTQDLSDFIDGKITIKDLEGKHTWRNAHTGEAFVTSGILQGIWGGWYPLSNVWDDWTGVGGYWEEDSDVRFYVHHWVLCDDLTDEQRQTWELYRATSAAEREAYLHGRGKPIQVRLF